MEGKALSISVDISSSTVIPVQEILPQVKMMAFMRLTFTLTLVAVLFCLIDFSEANYKNAPMNGIMFGKRGPSEYDSTGRTLTALCEIATEACQAWFPSQENK